MQPKRFSHIPAKLLGKVPLRAVLVIPFVVQVITAVGVVGYLSFQNGQRATHSLADQLLLETGYRIHQNLHSYLATPSAINRTNHNLIKLRILNLQNLDQWNQYLLEQVQIYHPTILYIGVGNTQGEYRSGEQLDDLSLRSNIANDSVGFRSYEVNKAGQRLGLKSTIPAFRLHQRQEYQSIAQAPKAIWTPVFTSLLQPTLLIARADPIFSPQQKFQGFTIASFRLDSIGRFLNGLTIGKAGQAFVIDRQGRLLATSTKEFPFRDHQTSRELIQATDSTTPLIRATAQYLQQTNVFAQKLNSPQQFEIDIERQHHHFVVLPFRDDYGLDWFIVVVIPESDFMTQIHANNQTTLLLCIGSAVIAIGLGILAARWVTQPLLELNAAAKKIAKGDWSQEITVHRHDEVGELAHSFNQMAQQLQYSFAEMETLNQALTSSKDQLATYNRSLEVQIHERTEALERANRELERLATTDSLTQLANRRRFDEYLSQEWNHALRSQTHLSLILCDVDYFKRYNDYYGHQTGDECLKGVAQAIRQALQRSTDLAAQYGGEEFGIILPYSDVVGATLVAQSIQRQVQQLKCLHARSEVSQHITVSLGIASVIPHLLLSPNDLLAAADLALYEAKTQGRDRYCVQQISELPNS